MSAVNLMERATIHDLQIRRAEARDAAAIAEAHRDSIRSLGASSYPVSVVDDWQEHIAADLYLRAMDAGEVFFIAAGTVGGTSLVLGFASDYRIEAATFGTSVYVRGLAARRGIGSALLRTAEQDAMARGAARIVIDASLAGVEFYRARGYVELGRGTTKLASGRPIDCVFMRKDL